MFNVGPIESLIVFGPLIVVAIVIIGARSNTRSGRVNTAHSSAAWFADPSGRHEGRYWDGSRWTSHVTDNGAVTTDPL